jgi:hypothetical protein
MSYSCGHALQVLHVEQRWESSRPHTRIKRSPHSTWTRCLSAKGTHDHGAAMTTSHDYFCRGLLYYDDWIHHGEENYQLLEQAAGMFQAAVDLERTSCIHTSIAQIQPRTDLSNLLVALRALATVFAAMSDRSSCIAVVDEIRYWKACKMPFSKEHNDTMDNNNRHHYEWVLSSWNHPVALKTMGQPLLDPTTIRTIQEAAQDYRNRRAKSVLSTRFTMQYAGNSDLHLADLVAHQPSLLSLFDSILQTQIYPLVRKPFLTTTCTENGDSTATLPLCVYDALIVRYDGKDAAQRGREQGAFLPLVSGLWMMRREWLLWHGSSTASGSRWSRSSSFSAFAIHGCH